jgi:hypothetical protein
MAIRNWSTSLIARSTKKPNLEFAVLLKELKVLMAVKRTTTTPAAADLDIFLCDCPEPSEPGVEILNFITPADLGTVDFAEFALEGMETEDVARACAAAASWSDWETPFTRAAEASGLTPVQVSIARIFFVG